jgi:deoxyadenosine/deoxycytidine kinase
MKTFKEFRKELLEAEEYKKAVEPVKSEQELEKAAKIAADTEGEHVFADEHKFYNALGLPDDFGVHKENFQEYKDLWQSVVDETDEDKVLQILKKHFK